MIVLRVMGYALVALGVAGIWLAFTDHAYQLFGYGSEDWWRRSIGAAEVLISPICGLASGIVLVRYRNETGSPLLPLAIVGLCLCGSLVAYQLVKFASYAQGVFAGEEKGPLWAFFFHSSNNGWPPKTYSLMRWLMSPTADVDADNYLRVTGVLSTFGSTPLWTLPPLAVCIWAVWGWRGGWGDKGFAIFAFVVAVSLAVLATFAAVDDYLNSLVQPPPGEVWDYLYIPRPGWYVSYAIVDLMLVAGALLLYQRGTKRRPADTV